jgi:hypothetical protein
MNGKKSGIKNKSSASCMIEHGKLSCDRSWLRATLKKIEIAEADVHFVGSHFLWLERLFKIQWIAYGIMNGPQARFFALQIRVMRNTGQI